ncbi:hypothetical protein EJ05DRAFT_473634 [Pseudovirgaria hyperparasitica]|uniref:CID domain-containing protein n=1 Tax=Pseudovirgaria hyperparasitica TaxID=470096 RepID=A0A6A6WED1_9PEZI|nr:uncharacterized protein EJ05DRAFT_473634 [Pseudovirgaria hyperparasitica]KAF2761073.1 hypothetical protein EJ05DRAFT_473634 [Pseudovirgaria hyperparasitica]
MADEKTDDAFPDITNKLSAPTKKSQYEKQKAEAEAKRLREEKETAAALKEFINDYGGPGESDPQPRATMAGRGRGGLGARLGDDELDPRGAAMGAKRHHVPRPGQARSGPGSLGPSTSFGNKKRTFWDTPKEGSRGVLQPEQSISGPVHVRAALESHEDDEDQAVATKTVEREPPKPTIRLSNIPPHTSESEIKELIPKSLTVESIRTERSGESRPMQRSAKAMIATLASNTPDKDIESALVKVQGAYLGWGYKLGVSKHLSTNALGSSTAHAPASTFLPFGAASRARDPSPPRQGSRFAPPPEERMDRGPHGRQQEAPLGPPEVQVVVPSDFRELRLIHKTLENMIIHGPEFEALLRKQPLIQRNEEWAWFWDPHSVGGVWYRWQLSNLMRQIDIDSDSDDELPSIESKGAIDLFEDSEPWCPPENDLAFMSPTKFSELIDDAAYHDTLELEDEEPKKPVAENTALSYLNPLQKARLIHLLQRLPTSTGKLRRGDIARITDFAITNASGAPEVVDIVISNILQPFALSCTTQNDYDEEQYPGIDTSIDPSNAKQIGLYAVSDILFASSASVARNSWRYRELFGDALRDRRIFETLGRLGKDLGWGVMRLNKWKRSITNVLELWDSKSVFPPEVQKHFEAAFESVTDKVKNDVDAADAADEDIQDPVAQDLEPPDDDDVDVDDDDDDLADAPSSDSDAPLDMSSDEDEPPEDAEHPEHTEPPEPVEASFVDDAAAARAQRLAAMRATLEALPPRRAPSSPPETADRNIGMDGSMDDNAAPEPVQSELPSQQEQQQQEEQSSAQPPPPTRPAFSMSLGSKPAIKMSLGAKQTADAETEPTEQETQKEQKEQKEQEAPTKRGRPRAADFL